MSDAHLATLAVEHGRTGYFLKRRHEQAEPPVHSRNRGGSTYSTALSIWKFTPSVLHPPWP